MLTKEEFHARIGMEAKREADRSWSRGGPSHWVTDVFEKGGVIWLTLLPQRTAPREIVRADVFERDFQWIERSTWTSLPTLTNSAGRRLLTR